MEQECAIEQYQNNTKYVLPKYSPIFRILMTNNSKRKAKIATLNVPIPIPIELLYFLSKKGQYIVPNNIADQYAHVCKQQYDKNVKAL